MEQDVVKIPDYFGKDFIAPEVKQHAVITMQQALLPHLGLADAVKELLCPFAGTMISFHLAHTGKLAAGHGT